MWLTAASFMLMNQQLTFSFQYNTQTVIRERYDSRRWYDHHGNDDMRGVTELSFKKHIGDHLDRI